MPTTTDSAVKPVFAKEVPALYERHFAHLTGSAISVGVIRERGYTTVLGHTALEKAGFAQAQVKRVPGILIPLHGVDGERVGYQYRPDHPREDKARGRVIKYENPAGAAIRIDCPPRCRAALGNPAVPLYITEGVKKVDALATAGVCAIGLTGVWGFKGKNPFGSSTVLADWDYVALKERPVYLVFDSDAATNPHVWAALDRLAALLEHKGAKVHVLRLPKGEEGAKVGVDDYLAKGGTLEALLATEEKEPPKAPVKKKLLDPDERYHVYGQSIFYEQPNRNGGVDEIKLADFSAKITAVVDRDDGGRLKRFFSLVGIDRNGGALPEVEVLVEQFASMGWVMKNWDVRAVIEAGPAAKDRVCKAILMNSAGAARRLIYEHTGWRRLNGSDAYLTPAGAIGAPDVQVELDDALKRYDIPLPQAGDDVVKIVQASVDFIGIGRYHVTLPLWASMYLAPLNEAVDTNFTLWLIGLSGCGKSRTIGLALSHFGDFDHLHLPAAWCDTRGKLEQLAYWAKDMPLVIDDFSPGQDWQQQKDMEAKADYICRNQGNRQGRGRMNSNNYVPRGLLIATGEQTPKGQSNLARHFVVSMKSDDVRKEALSSAQEERHLYRHAMGHYLTWLQRQWGELRPALRRRQRELRDEVYKIQSFESAHDRLPDMISLLWLGLETGLRFAVEVGALPQETADIYNETAREEFVKLALEQAERVNVERPALKFLEGLQTLADTGKVCFGNKDDQNPLPDTPNLPLIGWEDRENGHVYLQPEAAHQVVKQFWDRSGAPLTTKPAAIWNDMRALGMIEADEGRTTKVVRIYGGSMRVISLDKRYIHIIRKHGDPIGGSENW